MPAMPVTAADLNDEPVANPVVATEPPGALMTAAAGVDSSPAPTPSGMGLKLPAVDGVNGKVDALGGSFDDRSLYGLRGSLSVPLGDKFGVQVDALAGQLGNRDVYGVAGHLFWRDPSQGLLGLYAAHAKWNRTGGIRLNHVAAEGELYRGPITFRALAGRESGNSGSAVVGSFTETFNITTRFFGHANISYYLTDNLKLSGGVVRIGGKTALSLGGEWGWALSGGTMASVFVEGLAGEVPGVWAGIKFYFGQRQKALIRRHREDDPPSAMPTLMFGLSGSVNQAPTTLPPPPPPDGGGDGGD